MGKEVEVPAYEAMQNCAGMGARMRSSVALINARLQVWIPPIQSKTLVSRSKIFIGQAEFCRDLPYAS